VKKVIFYTEALWAFGSLHSELCKVLYGQGVNAILMDWKIPYTVAEMQEIDATGPIWCTEPHAIEVLVKQYGISPSRIVLICHSIADVEWAMDNINPDEYRQFIVISNFLAGVAADRGYMPWVQHIGANVHDFDYHHATELRRVGYAGTTRAEYAENKRPELIQRACEIAGLEFVTAEHYHNTFVTMPGFYKTVDAVVVASRHEGDGMISLEAGAAGRLVLSTPVGHWPELCENGGGITLPTDPDGIVEALVAHFTYFKDNPQEFAYICSGIQQYAKRYDWSKVAPAWAHLLS
jgi:glycosyltransferase involved in cell wall biosynthesis